ncbi:MAG TPA: hypothetical protein VHK69_00120 [Chitinophagaceae bacterium]|jgi:hypothetical protein|nr:hypothetical protein [Chitinophagaceae bacterium]
MPSSLLGGSSTYGFARRPIFISNGLVDDLDEPARKQIKQLSKVLGQRMLSGFDIHLPASPAPAPSVTGTAAVSKAVGGTPSSTIKPLDEDNLDWVDLLPPTFTGKLQTFEEIIDKKGDSSLLFEVQELITNSALGYNASKLLKEASLLHFLFCKAKYEEKFEKAPAIFKYVSNETAGGIKLVHDYIVKKAALQMVEDERIEVGDPDKFRENITARIKTQKLEFAERLFSAELKSIVRKVVYDQKEYTIVNKVKDQLNIADEDVPKLVQYIKKSKIEIDDDNAPYFLSIALSQIKTSGSPYSGGPEEKEDLAVDDFSVKYYDDDKGVLQVVRENVVCAAQMFYVMTLGDELDIFNVVNLITTKYLPSGKVDIRDKSLLQDLQLYVFSDSFRDIRTGALYKRTNPEERRMFYRQVFSMGQSEMVDGMVLNSDFKTLWEALLTETVKYIQKAERSENPQSFVSRQNIFQAIEDLQYNLSTHCTGMAKVMTPIVNRELDFVIERFLKKEDITRQLAFNNSGSFWKVIERVLRDAHGETPNVAALRTKAVYGHKILNTIANYSPALLNEDNNFHEFVTTVEGFIIAASQLEGGDAAREELHAHDELQPNLNGGGAGNGSAGDDWNF